MGTVVIETIVTQEPSDENGKGILVPTQPLSTQGLSCPLVN